MQTPPRSDLAPLWSLDPRTVFLNHGSFGACPRPVLDEQHRLRALMEADPVEFYMERLPGLWQEALDRLSDFLNADPAGMTFQVNATTGVNTVLRSIALAPGDEILLSDHRYQACRNAVEHACRRSGAKAVEVHIPFEAGDEEIIAVHLAAVTDQTRLALVDTVTSPTALRMPFERLTHELQAAGVDVLVDAAHGPGLVPLDLDALGAAYVAGNCHKWLYTPKASGFLHLRADRREVIEPLVTSHGYSSPGEPRQRFRARFDWLGTQDPTPWLCIPGTIDSLASLVPGGWPGLMARNRALGLQARELLGDLLGTAALAPADRATAMVAVRLPGSVPDDAGGVFEIDPLRRALYREFRIQAVVSPWLPHRRRYLRVSAAPYNSPEEFRYLVGALGTLGAA